MSPRATSSYFVYFTPAPPNDYLAEKSAHGGEIQAEALGERGLVPKAEKVSAEQLLPVALADLRRKRLRLKQPDVAPLPDLRRNGESG